MEQLNLDLPLDVVKELSAILNDLIETEVETKATFKHKFITESGKEVNNPTAKQINDKKLKQVLDVEKTIFEPKFTTTISEKGIKYTRLKYFLDEKLHKFSLTQSSETSESKKVEG